jgi:penicillin-binding protein 1A
MTQRARRRLRRRNHGSPGRKILLAFGVIAAVAAIGVAAAAAWVINVWDSAPALAELKPITKGTISRVYASDGSLLGVIHSDNIREPVPSDKIPAEVKQATVAIEDKGFYDHGAIDPAAIIRAGVADIGAGGKPVQGGSTITQQLVRNLYIAHPQDTLRRKIIEAHLASDLESQHSKDWILTKYLNTSPYGTNDGATAIGVEAAAEEYFSKHARDLTLPEAAMIAGLPQAPSEYNPFLNPRSARARRNEVLQAMLQQGDIHRAEYRQASAQTLGLNPGHKYNTIHQPYVFDLVKQELIDRYGANTVENGGLRVYTTIQPRLQEAAQRAVDSCSVCYSGGPASALASVNPQNGQIVALASTQRYSSQSQFNFAAQAHRQPGSSFKAYVLTTAIRQGIDPASTYYDGHSPKTLTTPAGEVWTVHNAEPAGGGTYSLEEATWDSVNVVFAQLGLDVGPSSFAHTAYQMGITSPLGVKSDGSGAPCKWGPNCYFPPADAIGGLSVGVTPLEQADAYATLADGGVHHPPTAIARVEFPDGKTDIPSSTDGKRVLTPGEAYEVTKILEGVITKGTGAGYTYMGCSSEAGKTGTSEGESDAWFVGYTPLYSTAVWTGHPLSRDYTGYGGPTSGPIWRSFMEAAQGSNCPDFEVPSSFASLSPFYGGHTVSGASQSGYGGSYTYGSTTPTYTSTTPTTTTSTSTSTYPPQDYAPGAGQQPLPTPGGGNGNGNGLGTGGGTGPPSP